MARKRHRFADRRKVVGLSQEALAEHLDVDRSTVLRWERGRTQPQPWHRTRLAQALNVSMETLDLLLADSPPEPSHTTEMPDSGTAGHMPHGAEDPDTAGQSIPADTLNSQLVTDPAHRRGLPLGVEHVSAHGMANALLPTPSLGATRRTLLIGIAAVAASCGLLGNEAKGRRLGVGDVERIHAVTALYRSVDYECGGGVLYTEVSRFAESASELLDQTYPPALAPRLLAAVAAARQLAGWAAFDSCRHTDAQRHLLAAERVAMAAGDPLLVARVRYCQARQYQHLRHNRDALETLRLARDHLDGRSTAAVATMLDGAQAASLAALGDRKPALALLGQAEARFSEIDIEREPEWMHFYDRGELLAQYGRVYRDLARANRKHGRDAVTFTTEAIGAFNPQNARSNVLNQVGLCSALFLADEPEQAAAVGTRAIEQARVLASPRIVDRLRNVRHDLAGYQKVPAVAEFAHSLTTLVPGRAT